MIRSFRNTDLENFWKNSKPLPHKTPEAMMVLRLLDLIDAAAAPRDLADFGLRFDEWIEADTVRFSVMLTDHWIVSYGWAAGDALELDFEWLN
jgi:plasmid maintenance system killer protein